MAGEREQISEEILIIKKSFQTEIEREYKEPGMATLERRWTNLLMNRDVPIVEAMRFVDRPALASALAAVKFEGETAKDVIAHSRALFIDLRQATGLSAVKIMLKEFDDGGYGKQANHQIVVQRAENTQLPPKGGVWTESTLWATSLVAMADDHEPVPVLRSVKEPNLDLFPGMIFAFTLNGQLVESPLAVGVPLYPAFARNTMNHDGAPMYGGRVLLVSRYPNKDAVTIEPSMTVLSHPRANAAPRNILPSR